MSKERPSSGKKAGKLPEVDRFTLFRTRGAAAAKTKKYRDAVGLYVSALHVADDAGRRDREVFLCNSELGDTYMCLKDYLSAQTSYIAALSIAEELLTTASDKTKGGCTADVCEALNNMAYLFYSKALGYDRFSAVRLSSFEQAKGWYLRLIGVAEKGTAPHLDALLNIGSLHVNAGHYKEAVEVLKEAVSVQEGVKVKAEETNPAHSKNAVAKKLNSAQRRLGQQEAQRAALTIQFAFRRLKKAKIEGSCLREIQRVGRAFLCRKVVSLLAVQNKVLLSSLQKTRNSIEVNQRQPRRTSMAPRKRGGTRSIDILDESIHAPRISLMSPILETTEVETQTQGEVAPQLMTESVATTYHRKSLPLCAMCSDRPVLREVERLVVSPRREVEVPALCSHEAFVATSAVPVELVESTLQVCLNQEVPTLCASERFCTSPLSVGVSVGLSAPSLVSSTPSPVVLGSTANSFHQHPRTSPRVSVGLSAPSLVSSTPSPVVLASNANSFHQFPRSSPRVSVGLSAPSLVSSAPSPVVLTSNANSFHQRTSPPSVGVSVGLSAPSLVSSTPSPVVLASNANSFHQHPRTSPRVSVGLSAPSLVSSAPSPVVLTSNANSFHQLPPCHPDLAASERCSVMSPASTHLLEDEYFSDTALSVLEEVEWRERKEVELGCWEEWAGVVTGWAGRRCGAPARSMPRGEPKVPPHPPLAGDGCGWGGTMKAELPVTEGSTTAVRHAAVQECAARITALDRETEVRRRISVRRCLDYHKLRVQAKVELEADGEEAARLG